MNCRAQEDSPLQHPTAGGGHPETQTLPTPTHAVSLASHRPGTHLYSIRQPEAAILKHRHPASDTV